MFYRWTLFCCGCNLCVFLHAVREFSIFSWGAKLPLTCVESRCNFQVHQSFDIVTWILGTKTLIAVLHQLFKINCSFTSFRIANCNAIRENSRSTYMCRKESFTHCEFHSLFSSHRKRLNLVSGLHYHFTFHYHYHFTFCNFLFNRMPISVWLCTRERKQTASTHGLTLANIEHITKQSEV